MNLDMICARNSATGQPVELQANPDGSLVVGTAQGVSVGTGNPMPILDGYLPVQTATWNTSTNVNTALTSSTLGMDTVIVTANVTTGTVTGGTIYFEVWDGAAWLPTKVPRIESYATDTVASLAGNNSISSAQQHAWQVPVAGFTQYRTRLATAVTGTGSPSITIAHLVSSAPDTSLVTVGLDPAQAVIPQATITETTGSATSSSGTTPLSTPAAGAITKFVEIQNNNGSGTLYVNFGAAATTSSRQIAAGQAWALPVVPTQALYILGSTTLNYVVTWA